MIRVMMLDLGETLVRKNAQGAYETFPHVQSALDALMQIRCPDGNPPLTCLVSDFRLTTSPAEIAKQFVRFLEILEGVGLRGYFEPVEKHVTLSTHAGVSKPDSRIFHMALRRLGSDAALSECLFITENAGHISACSALGMHTLRFGIPEDEGGFQNWRRGPNIISALVSKSDK